MKKITTAAKKSAPKFVGENRVQVTREFAKNAMIFGTPEYKLWREIKADCPDAQMELKTIKKSTSHSSSPSSAATIPTTTASFPATIPISSQSSARHFSTPYVVSAFS